MDRGSFFPKEDIKIIKRHMKICSISLKSSQKGKSKPQTVTIVQSLLEEERPQQDKETAIPASSAEHSPQVTCLMFAATGVNSGESSNI